MNQPKVPAALSIILVFLILVSWPAALNAQMRQMYVDANADNEVRKINFYSTSAGFVAFRDWVGYTADSGRTFTKKYITNTNVDFNGYSVNLTIGFWISGVKAFSQSTIIVYGHYGFVPAILYSTNGGNSFKLVYQSQFDPLELKTGITDMGFLQDNVTGYAVDADRIFKTTNGGLSWNVLIAFPSSYFTDLQVIDNNNIVASSSVYNRNKIVKTANGGSLWTTLARPSGTSLLNTYFLSSTIGWLSTNDNNIYKTTDGAGSWSLVTDPSIANFSGKKMKFLDANTGYSLSDGESVFKTLNGGLTWEPLPGTRNALTPGAIDKDLFFFNSNQFWAGGSNGYLEITTNAGGLPALKSFFKADTAGVWSTNKVNLNNYSRQGYAYKWLVNGTQLSTLYNSSYIHNAFHLIDTISLIVNDGAKADTATKMLYFFPPVIVKSFSPASGGSGSAIEIRGSNFTGVTNVGFGNTAASSFSILTDTSIRAIVGNGSSGEVRVSKPDGVGSLTGFTFVNPPAITSCNPMAAAAGTTVIITGVNFIGVSSVSFGSIPASFNVVSATTISATVPSGTSGEIKVVTIGGTAALSGFVAIPTVASFTPSSGTTGTVMTIKGTSFTTVSAITIGGVNVLSFTIGDANTITAVVGTGTSGQVTVVSPGGNSSQAGFTWLAPPVIASFSPIAGAVGSSVVINGNGFSTVAGNNIVLFGSVKATVTAASSTSLTVTVPYGAAYKPVSATFNNLTGFSKVPFLVTFANGGSITAASFDSLNVAALPSEVYPTKIELKDFDGDGKDDIALQEYSNNPNVKSGIIFFKNYTIASAVAYQNATTLPAGYCFASADMDGDGKMDIVSGTDNGINLYKNISSASSIAFDNVVIIPVISHVDMVAIADIDMDGKPDIITNGIVVYKNISEPGKLQFRPGVLVSSIRISPNIIIADLDMDGKPEIITGDNVLKNNSSPINISFTQQPTTGLPSGGVAAVGDIDGDGKLDIASINSNEMVVLRNTSSVGNLSFAQPIESGVSSATDIALSDMDGDGKADICLTQADRKLAVYKNLSVIGNINLTSAASYGWRSPVSQGSISIADIDNDGKNDVVACTTAQQGVSVFINKVKPEPFVISISPTIGGLGATINITGVNFSNVLSVKFGGVPALSYIVNNAASITAIVGNGASGPVSITNNYGTCSFNSFVFASPPSIDSISPLAAIPGVVVTILGKGFSTSLASNTILFGGNKAKLLTANTSTITAEVPFGSQYLPVSVSANGLVAYSGLPFSTAFQASNDSLNAQSFGLKNYISFTPSRSFADIDGDGKLDLLWLNSSSLKVHLNNSVSGQIAFSNEVQGATMEGNATMPVIGDIDGDGKPDIILNQNDRLFSIYRNKSTIGSVAFESSKSFISGNKTAFFPSAVADIDKDGKADILLCSNASHAVAVVRNTTANQILSFEQDMLSLPLAGGATDGILTDIDGDNKPDIIATSDGGISFEIFLNTSNPGKVSFASKLSFGSGAGRIVICDADKDGKMDVLLAQGNSIYIYRNTSGIGHISFSSPVMLDAGTTVSLAVNDLNGDGLPDLIALKSALQKLTVFKNKSTIGNINFVATDIDYSIPPVYNYCGSADFDNDGKADLIVAGAIFRNKSGGSGPSIFSFSPISATKGNSVTITGNDFLNSTSVSFGNLAADSFFIMSNNVITAYPANGASGNVIIKSGLNIASKEGFIYSNSLLISQFKPFVGTGGTVINIEGANFSNVTSVSFGNTPAKSFIINSGTSITAIVASPSNTGAVKIIAGADTVTATGFVYKEKPQILSFAPTTGSISMKVTITGKNMQNVTSVQVGGLPIQSFTIVSTDTIIAILNEVTSGDITIANEVGSSSLGSFNYITEASITSIYPAVATQGTEVKIVGKNLGSVNLVQFGGVPATSFTVTSPTSITAIVGAAASGDVSVRNFDGTYFFTGFKYIAASVPGIASFTPARAAGGTVVEIGGINFNGITAVSFGGVAAASYTVVSPTLIRATVPSNAVSGDVVLTNAGGIATLSSFIFVSVPYISSFYPTAAATGNTVTIYGSNFSSVAANNIVYFGAVKAIVTSASSNKLLATVPKQATYSKVSVTTGNLTAFSSKSFVPVFASKADLSDNTFRLRADSSFSTTSADLKLADIDLDTKADLTLAGGSLSVIRNIYSTGKLLFSPPITINNTPHPYRHAWADFNGDGLLDMAVLNGDDINSLFIAKNTSTPGTASFGTPLNLNPGIEVLYITTCDLDGDGKTDIITVSSISGISIFLNTSSASIISFAPRIDYPNQGLSRSIFIEDIDIDGKPDLVVSSGSGIDIWRNTSTLQNLSFDVIALTGINMPSGGIATGDFNNDGLPDIVVTSNSKNILILENNCKPGGFIYFKINRSFQCDFNVNDPSVGDVNGDGKVDVVTNSQGLNAVVFKNTGSNSFSFNESYSYAANNITGKITVGDLDGDGKPELIATNNVDMVSIFKNSMVSSLTTFILCPGSNAVFVSDVTGTGYQWQVNSGNGYINISDNAYYSGTGTSKLIISNAQSVWYGYTYRCKVQNKFSTAFSLKFENNWTGASNFFWNNPFNWSCNIVPDGNTDVVVSSGAVVLNTTGTCRSITVAPGASLTITGGNSLIVTH